LFFLLFCISAGFADTSSENGGFWISLSPETALYSYSGVSFGGGLSLGYGKGTTIGLKTAWFYNSTGVSVLEINILYRIYFSSRKAYSGSFLQFLGGPALFFGKEDELSFPAKTGAFSVGVGYGWRFLIKDLWYVEPSVRVGFPYMVGAGISAGMRF